MVSRTAEIRWWSSNKSEMWDWFLENIWKDCKDHPETRTDYYLKSSINGIGVKWREGNFELKFRTSQFDTKNGVGEAFLKESLSSELSMNDLPDNGLISVKKKRQKRMFESGKGFVQIENTSLSEGCQIEFAKVEFGRNKIFYTICFEAFGDKQNEIEILKETMMLFPLPTALFSLDNASGYASKIKMLALESEH